MSSKGYGFPARVGRSYKTIESIARGVRRAFDLSPLKKLPGADLFDRLDSYHVEVGKSEIALDFAVLDLPPGVKAKAQFDSGRRSILVVLSPETYLKLLRGVPRAIFSLCHEIGHAVMHTAELMQLAAIPDRTAALMRAGLPPVKPYLDVEWQADAFAGALMIPAEGLAYLESRGMLNVSAIQEHFNVSGSCASMASPGTESHQESSG